MSKRGRYRKFSVDFEPEAWQSDNDDNFNFTDYAREPERELHNPRDGEGHLELDNPGDVGHEGHIPAERQHIIEVNNPGDVGQDGGIPAERNHGFEVDNPGDVGQDGGIPAERHHGFEVDNPVDVEQEVHQIPEVVVEQETNDQVTDVAEEDEEMLNEEGNFFF